MQLLQDVFIIENLQVLTEGKANSIMKISGTFGRCNEKNNNGRIYPTAVMEAQLARVLPLIKERRLCGELDHPQNDIVRLANASHLITKLEMRGDELIGEAEILKTPAGLTAQALVNGGVKIGISSRGMGTLSEDHNGDKIVNDDFRLVTFDLVADPSTRGAYPSLSESTQSKFAQKTQSKLQKEGNFITMLENKMKEAYQPWIDEAMAGKGDTAAERKADRERANKDRLARRGSDKEEANEENKKFKKTNMKEAFEYVRADGHWHRIAEIIKEALLGEVFQGGEDDVGDTEARERAAKAETAAAKAQRSTERAKSSISGAIKRRVGAGIEARGEEKRADKSLGRAQQRADIEQSGTQKRAASGSKFAHGERVKGVERGGALHKRASQVDVRGHAATKGAEVQKERQSAAAGLAKRTTGHATAAAKRNIDTAAKKAKGAKKPRGVDFSVSPKKSITANTEHEKFGQILSESFDLETGW